MNFAVEWQQASGAPLNGTPGFNIIEFYLGWCRMKRTHHGMSPNPTEVIRRLDRAELLRDRDVYQYTAADLEHVGTRLAELHATQLAVYSNGRHCVPLGNSLYALKVIEAAMKDCGYVLADDLQIDKVREDFSALCAAARAHRAAGSNDAAGAGSQD